MTWVAAAIATSAVIGGVSSNNAANAQIQAANTAANQQQRQFDKQVELQAPWRKAGENALNQLIPLASNYTPFGTEQFQQDPGYAFRVNEGIKALDRSAAARGGLLSGNQLRGVTEYGQNAASQEYQNAFNRYQAERQARLGPLQSLAGVGQSSANTLSNAAGQLGTNLADLSVGAGNARASSYIGGANAISNGAGQYLNYNQNQNMLNTFRNFGSNANNGGGLNFGSSSNGSGGMTGI